MRERSDDARTGAKPRPRKSPPEVAVTTAIDMKRNWHEMANEILKWRKKKKKYFSEVRGALLLLRKRSFV